MFKGIREYAARVLDALLALVEATNAAPSGTLEALTRRVDALELGLAKERAEAEAVLMKAEAERRTARRSEERTRAMLKGRDDDETLDGDQDGEGAFQPWQGVLPAGNGSGSPQGGMSPVPPSVGRSRADKRAAAIRAKFNQ